MSEVYEFEGSVESRVAHLEQAVGLRRVVGQAQGILMERHGLTAEQALARLRASSRQAGGGLHHTASELIRTRAEPVRRLGWEPARPS